MLSKAVKFLLLTEAFAVATYAVGWWGVPVLALICGLAVEPKARPLRFISLCAAAGWATAYSDVRLELTLRNLALIYRDLGDDAQTRSYLTRALAVADRHGDSGNYAATLGTYAS